MRPLLWIAAGATCGTYLLAGPAVAAVYGQEGFGPAVAALELFAPALLLFFTDILLGHACVAAGSEGVRGGEGGVGGRVSTALDVVLVPLLQQRTGNGVLGGARVRREQTRHDRRRDRLLPGRALHQGLVADARARRRR
jgi:hypothetical protein